MLSFFTKTIFAEKLQQQGHKYTSVLTIMQSLHKTRSIGAAIEGVLLKKLSIKIS